MLLSLALAVIACCWNVDASVEVECPGVSDLIGVCGMILLWEAIGVFQGVRVLRLSA